MHDSVGVGERAYVCVRESVYGIEREEMCLTVTPLRAVLVGQDGWERETDAGIDGWMNDRREEGDLLS